MSNVENDINAHNKEQRHHEEIAINNDGEKINQIIVLV